MFGLKVEVARWPEHEVAGLAASTVVKERGQKLGQAKKSQGQLPMTDFLPLSPTSRLSPS